MERTSFNWPPKGFRFTPTDEQLVRYYLKPKNDGLPHDREVIRDYNIYSCLPQRLPRDRQYGKRNELYFFVREDWAESRKVGPVKDVSNYYFWRPTGRKEIPIKEIIAQKMNLALCLKRGNETIKTNWMMHEYGLVKPSSSTKRASRRKNGFRVCRIYWNKGKNTPLEDDAASPASTDSSRSDEDLTRSPVEIPSESNAASPDAPGFPCYNEDLATSQPEISSDLVAPIQGSSGFPWSMEGAYLGIPAESNAALAADSLDFDFDNEDPEAWLLEIPSEPAATGPGSPGFSWRE